MLQRLNSLYRIFRNPVSQEAQDDLARASGRVPEEFRAPWQLLGLSSNGCGATIGAMPRCDFACTGCYLGAGANHVPPLSVEEVKDQMRRLRPWLGERGNLQLTDGEVILRPVEEVIELLRYARQVGLIPMLMTHGDAFRRRPGLLERLMVEGEMDELGIHIDTTQRGRSGAAYKHARREEELMPLRDEFAQLCRRAKKQTRRPLRVATTMTVTADNLESIPAVLRWMKRNADVFRMISFQPVAQVGRTENAIGGVHRDELWARIAEGLAPADVDAHQLLDAQMWMGHPDCNRILTGVIATDADSQPKFLPVRRPGNATDERIIDTFLARFGRVTFRGDSATERCARLLGLLRRAPGFALTNLLPYTGYWLRRFDPHRPGRFVFRLVTGRATVRQLTIVSHHFMNRAEVESPRGKERLNLCVFRVPIGDRLVSMCEVNTLGVRERFYAGEEQLAGRA